MISSPAGAGPKVVELLRGGRISLLLKLQQDRTSMSSGDALVTAADL
jgi:hypothetical protein